MFSPCGKNSSSHIQTSAQTGLTRGFQEQYIPHQQAKKAKSPSRLKNKFPCWLRLQRVWSWSELKPHTCCTWTTTSELSSTQLVTKCLYANQVYTLSSEKKTSNKQSLFGFQMCDFYHLLRKLRKWGKYYMEQDTSSETLYTHCFLKQTKKT